MPKPVHIASGVGRVEPRDEATRADPVPQPTHLKERNVTDWDDMQAAGVVDAVEAVFDEAPRLSPAARRFMAGDMTEAEAIARGYTQPKGQET